MVLSLQNVPILTPEARERNSLSIVTSLRVGATTVKNGIGIDCDAPVVFPVLNVGVGDLTAAIEAAQQISMSKGIVGHPNYAHSKFMMLLINEARKVTSNFIETTQVKLGDTVESGIYRLVSPDFASFTLISLQPEEGLIGSPNQDQRDLLDSLREGLFSGYGRGFHPHSHFDTGGNILCCAAYCFARSLRR